MRSLLPSLAVLALACPAASAIEPYAPLPLAPAQVITPPDDLRTAAAALLAAAKASDVDAAAPFLAPQIRSVDGALELHIARFTQVVGPHDSPEAMLSDLADYIGGDVEPPPPGGDPLPNRLRAEFQYIESALEYADEWGTDPMVEGAVCTYAYRSYDRAAIAALSEATGVASSSFVYVDAPYELHTEPSAVSAPKATMEPDLLYALDYDSTAPGRWIGVYLPDGTTGFANFDAVDLKKPYLAGLCFAKSEAGDWQVVAQISTSL